MMLVKQCLLCVQALVLLLQAAARNRQWCTGTQQRCAAEQRKHTDQAMAIDFHYFACQAVLSSSNVERVYNRVGLRRKSN